MDDQLSRDPSPAECSSRGCRNAAVWVLAWNNPRLHTADRRKTWAACAGHRDELADFLGRRQFLREVVTIEEWEARRGRAGA